MSNQGEGVDNSYSVSEDLSAKQFFCMKHGATIGLALLATSAGAFVVGILQEQGIDGSTNVINAQIRTSGESMVKLGGTVAIGDPAQTDASGQAILGAAADEIFGRFLEAGVTGDIVRMHVDSEGIKA